MTIQGRKLRTIAALAVVQTCLLAIPDARAQSSPYGMVTHDLDSLRANKVTELGAGFARISIRWWQIEPSKGRFVWTTLDDYVWNQAAPRSIRLFMSLGEPPSWAGGGPTHNGHPTDPRDWYTFVFAVVNRYKEYVKHWGIWNEPNLSQFLDDRSRYQEIAYWARQAIKDADSQALVLGPEVSEHALDDGWFAGVMSEYGRHYFDVVTIHSYTGSLARRLDTQVYPWRFGKDVWLTEIGRQAFSGLTLTERVQRDFFTGSLNTFQQRRSWLKKIFFYDLWAWDYGYRFGICGPNWTNNLAFDGYRDWITSWRVVNSPTDTILYNRGTGRWSLVGTAGRQAFAEIGRGTWAASSDLMTADFNGDGLADVLRHDVGTGEWTKALNDGWGGFSEFSSRWTSGWRVTPLDLNADSRSDLFLYNPTTGDWLEAFSVGDGDFAYVAGHWSPSWELYPLDLNGDGASDLFLYNRLTGQWFRAINDRAGTFTYWSEFWSPGWTILPGDFDADGSSDLFLYNEGSGQWFVAISVGNSFRYRAGFWSPGWQVHAADIDANRMADVFLYNATSGQWFEGLSRGEGRFEYHTGYWSPAWRVWMTDFNGDSRSDVLLYNVSSGNWFQALNVAVGSFLYQRGSWEAGMDVVPGRSRQR